MYKKQIHYFFKSHRATEYTEGALWDSFTEKTEVPSALTQSLPDGFSVHSVAQFGTNQACGLSLIEQKKLCVLCDSVCK